MNISLDRERQCGLLFQEAGDIWHLWTSENHPLIFASREEFISGMDIMGITARLCPAMRILTFEIMSNHIHAVVAGKEVDVRTFFDLFKHLLSNYFQGGRYESKRQMRERKVDLYSFSCSYRKLENVAEVRNAIVSVNRKGYLVSPDESPYSYPWGANRYYFNPDAKMVAAVCNESFTRKERMQIIHSHMADKIGSLKKVYGYACPMDFCAVKEGESLFLNASQYFDIISG